jgi:hypothetical protein
MKKKLFWGIITVFALAGLLVLAGCPTDSSSSSNEDVPWKNDANGVTFVLDNSNNAFVCNIPASVLGTAAFIAGKLKEVSGKTDTYKMEDMTSDNSIVRGALPDLADVEFTYTYSPDRKTLTISAAPEYKLVLGVSFIVGTYKK